MVVRVVYTAKNQKSPWDQWKAWAAENYVWLLPIVTATIGPIVGTLTKIIYDAVSKKT
jgi:hypothetical protein